MSSHHSRSTLDDALANQNSQFSQNRSRLTRQDLYSYGFKEGQSWGDDRRALESALREIDQHEREIRENYLYNSPTRSNAPWPSFPASPQGYLTAHSGTHYRSQLRSPPDYRINRSNGSDSQSESSISPWAGRQSSHPYRSFSESTGYSRGKSGRPDGFYSATNHDTPSPSRRRSGGYVPPSKSVPRIRTSTLFPPPPPLNSASSSYRGYFPSEDSHSFVESPSQYHESHVPPSSHSPTSQFPHTFIGHDETQLVRHSVYAQRKDSAYGEQPEDEPPSPQHSSSAHWSINGTRDVDSANFSDLSRESYELYDSSQYPHNASSGYVESYKDSYHNYGTAYRESYLHDLDDDDSDREYMSDGIASDEGVYYSSSEGPDEDYEGEEVFSDEGYGSSYSDGFYDSD